MFGELAIKKILDVAAIKAKYGYTVYYDRVQQETPVPYITVRRQSGMETTDDKDGASGLDMDTVQVIISARTKLDATKIARDVRVLLDRAVAQGDYNGVTVDSVSLIDASAFESQLTDSTIYDEELLFKVMTRQ